MREREKKNKQIAQASSEGAMVFLGGKTAASTWWKRKAVKQKRGKKRTPN